MNARIRKTAVIIIPTFLFLVAGCTIPTKLQTESKSIVLRRAKYVRAEIIMDAGTLKVAGGAEELLDAKFRYNVASWKPKIEYEINRGQGELRVEQRRGMRGAPVGRVRNEWNLRLNDDVPMYLNVELGAGKSDLKLGSMSLRKLNVVSGAGNVKLDMRGSPSLTSLYLDMGAGEVTVDLTGNWRRNLDVNIKGGVGKTTLRLPKDVGVHVDAKEGIGKIKARGLRRHGNIYTNNAYGKSELTLRIDVKGGVGEINLELGN